MTENQTTVEQAFDAAPNAPTVEAPAPEVTEENPTLEKGAGQEAEPVIDYKEKFSHSSAEAQRLLQENKDKDAEIERLRLLAEPPAPEPGESSEALFPGFEELDENQQRDLEQFTGTIRKQAVDEVMKDPAIAFARRNYAESQFDASFQEVARELPQLLESSAEFKQKFFNPNAATPSNLKAILLDLGKGFLFDKARDIGVQEGREQAERIEVERALGGDGHQVTTHRTLEEWSRMQQENPAEFAKHSKEYHEDLAAGRLGE